MNKIENLDVFLYEKKIGTITNLPGDRNVFSFNQTYIDDPLRSTLSLSFKDIYGNLITNIKSTHTRLSPFFSNLLPEGYLREYLASQAKVNSEKEFYLLAALGYDLPGALKIYPGNEIDTNLPTSEEIEEDLDKINDTMLHFSLAGVQLKFSASLINESKFTIPAHGIGGAWIVKLPSHSYPGVSENEYAMMELAKQVGIHVPDTRLISIEKISGIPNIFKNAGEKVYAVKRFDRQTNGDPVHMEDFAQVFNIYPDKKYKAASYRNIAQVIWSEIGEEGIIEFIRRFVFNALIGNGDMHLKNWSFIYPDRRTPMLAPAYDFVSTIPYLPDDALALTFVDSKLFSSLTHDQFKRFADKAQLPETLVLDTMKETIEKFKEAWNSFQFEKKNIIDKHLITIPIYKE